MSLYKFTDINSRAPAGRTLPAEAVCIDGKFLENEVAGYTTLQVTGRELYSADIEDSTIKGMSGSKFLYRTYPARTITVKYQLRADSNQQFRTYYNKLNTLLNKEQVEISFNDEPDKYFVGSPKGITEVDGGVNTVVGEFEIYCTDPCKYSKVIKETTGSIDENGDTVLLFTNEGTVPVPINYDIVNASETGYLGIVSEEGAMEFGKIDEADGVNYQQNETIVRFTDLVECEAEAIGQTGLDPAHPKDTTQATFTTATWFDHKFICLDQGSTPQDAEAKAIKTLVLPPDSNGNKEGCQNFYSYFHVLFYAGLMGQTGEMTVNFLTKDGKQICGVTWYKTDASGNTGHYELWANGKCLKVYTYTTSHLHSQNPWYWDWGHCDMRKIGSKLRFFYWGGYPEYDIPEVKDMKCAKVQLCIKKYKGRGGKKYLTFNGINELYLNKLNVDKWRDVPNRYPAGSTITIDGDTTKVYVNGMPKQEDEILGSKYFKSKPGANKIRIKTSSWTKKQPVVKAYIREAWL